MPWMRLGAGTYNNAYRDLEWSKVLKVQKTFDEYLPPTDLPIRSVRLWNEINYGLLPEAYITDSEYGLGWVCPYIEGEEASDDEIQMALIDIYNRTGRIVVDATAHRNFIKASNGQIVCVDIGFALQMEKREADFLSRTTNRRKSEVSLQAWNDTQLGFRDFFTQSYNKFPNSITTIKALLFIKANRPDIYNVDFLQDDPKITEQLALAYDRSLKSWWKRSEKHAVKLIDTMNSRKTATDTAVTPIEPTQPNDANDDVFTTIDLDDKTPDKPLVQAARNKLNHQAPITPDSIKQSCIEQLQQYIRSRGSINAIGQFKQSIMTFLFMDRHLTDKKVLEATRLIDQINEIDTLSELKQLIDEARTTPSIMKSRFTKGMATCLGRCVLNLEVAKEAGLDFDLVLNTSPKSNSPY